MVRWPYLKNHWYKPRSYIIVMVIDEGERTGLPLAVWESDDPAQVSISIQI